MPSVPAPGHVVLVHGVGLDASTFTHVAVGLCRRGFDTTVVRRRGYDDRPPTGDLHRHRDDILDAVDAVPGTAPVVVAGVSGGATLAVTVAAAAHQRVVGVVAHEPLVGRIAPAQHAAVTSSIDALLADPDAVGVEAFLERLVTPAGWSALAPAIRRRALGHADAILVDVPGFRDYVVDPLEFAAGTQVVWTVGGRSPTFRHSAASVGLALGADVVVLDAAHTPQVEAPAAFAATIAGAFT